MRSLLETLVFATLLASPAMALQSFQGHHPPGKKGTFCRIERPHFHAYDVIQPRAHWRRGPNGYLFVGDPGLFTYGGKTTTYHHYHPIPTQHGGGWCFIGGGHEHTFAPADLSNFEVAKKVHYYVGPFPANYEAMRESGAPQTKFYALAKYKKAKTKPIRAWRQHWRERINSPVPTTTVQPEEPLPLPPPPDPAAHGETATEPAVEPATESTASPAPPPTERAPAATALERRKAKLAQLREKRAAAEQKRKAAAKERKRRILAGKKSGTR